MSAPDFLDSAESDDTAYADVLTGSMAECESESEEVVCLPGVATSDPLMLYLKEAGNAPAAADIASEFKVTRERIRLTEEKALKKLRHPE